jgi:uncharacterized protein YdiU (UPF0061 family)
LQFENSFVGALPADPDLVNRPRQVHNACYTRVEPTPVTAPQLLAWSEDMGRQLCIGRPSGAAADPMVEVLAGNRLLPGMQPYAARYGGHQFGHWAGQLGDGRAITLGELVGADATRQELQLKGAGRTPYSRTADGRAVLRSSLREFLCSEAMHHLGVPTTRALSLVATGEPVLRDMFYDGHPREEPGAVVCRVAPSFLRFGNFQVHAAQGEHETLRRLADFVRTNYFSNKSIQETFREICRRTGLLMADWMRLGFVHGVMNTDNMSILGLTIDYGPYGWLEGYDLEWTPNTTDAEGRRYCYGNQPHVAQWNLARLAEALLPLIPDPAALEDGLTVYADTFADAWRKALARKLGLAALDQPGDDELAAGLFQLLAEKETDFTIFFRNLATPTAESLRPAYYGDMPMESLGAWLPLYRSRISREDLSESERQTRMNSVNPKYVFRNYLAQQAIDAIEQDGDSSVLERLMRVLERPYDEQPGHQDLATRRPEWARHKAGCSALSCSS